MRLRQHIRMQEQLNEAKLVFFTNVSHEFRTPLTLIRGALERIRESRQLPDALEQPMTLLEHNSDRLMHLINQLLEFRRMENNVMSLRLEKMDIMGLLRELFGDVAVAREAHRVEREPFRLGGVEGVPRGQADTGVEEDILVERLVGHILAQDQEVFRPGVGHLAPARRGERQQGASEQQDGDCAFHRVTGLWSNASKRSRRSLRSAGSPPLPCRSRGTRPQRAGSRDGSGPGLWRKRRNRCRGCPCPRRGRSPLRRPSGPSRP